MRGSQLRGMATASSTAAPKDMASPAAVTALPEKKMTLHNTKVSKNRAAMVSLLIQPRSVTPTAIHRTMRAPMTRHHTQWPTAKMPPMARAPS